MYDNGRKNKLFTDEVKGGIDRTGCAWNMWCVCVVRSSGEVPAYRWLCVCVCVCV